MALGNSAMFSNITIVGGPLLLSSYEDVLHAETTLGTRFPIGYREYITSLGEGVLGGSYVRIYPPMKIIAELSEWRVRIDEFWFWSAGWTGLTKEKAQQSTIIGDTLDGDELVTHPRDPNKIFVLPRHHERVFVAGKGLAAAIEWLCSSGVLTDPFKERNFEPFTNQNVA
jgi:hypothetical protein